MPFSADWPEQARRGYALASLRPRVWPSERKGGKTRKLQPKRPWDEADKARPVYLPTYDLPWCAGPNLATLPVSRLSDTYQVEGSECTKIMALRGAR